MADKWKSISGIDRARNPSAIINDQHDDKSLSARNQSGSPGTVSAIISNAATAQLIPAGCVIRVMNTDTANQFLAIGVGPTNAAVPAGTPALADGIALAPGAYENFFIGHPLALTDCVWIKASSNNVQVVVFEL